MNEKQLEDELSNLIAQHSNWLDGRTFQKVAMQIAAGFFSEDDLDPVAIIDADFLEKFTEGAKRGLSSG